MEIQIRTRQMHEIAEYGLAAHWSYKQGEAIRKEGKQFRWIRELLEILEQSTGAEDFLENTKLAMYHDQVFCFSPKGDIMPLPRGATPVDFAYSIHSHVGNSCVGAKVNGRIVPLKSKLRNGDQVEIITTKGQTPSPAWERFVVTAKARSEIRKFIRQSKREEYVNLGRAILGKAYREKREQELTDRQMQPIAEKLERKSVEDVYAEVGEGLLQRTQVLDLLIPNQKQNPKKGFNILERITGRTREKTTGMPIKGLIPGMAIHFAGCCHPIPGDKIVGIVTTGRGVTIHTTDCDTLDNFTDSPERWVDVAWDSEEERSHISRLRASVSHEMGAMAAIANAIAREEGNISNFKIINRNTDFFELLIDVEVRDTDHVARIIATLRTQDVVQSIDRYHD
jgi:GTP pyrophosphokinase